MSSGGRKVYRLSLRGNRRLNHAIHMVAITQIRHKDSGGRGYYEWKIAEGKTHKEALRCLKRRISDALYARLRADARAAGPGGQPGNHSVSRAAGSHPERQLFRSATPGPQTSLRAAAPLTSAIPPPEPLANKPRRATRQRQQQRGFDLRRQNGPGVHWLGCADQDVLSCHIRSDHVVAAGLAQHPSHRWRGGGRDHQAGDRRTLRDTVLLRAPPPQAPLPGGRGVGEAW